MDLAGIEIAVLSQTAPGVQASMTASDANELAQRTNDHLQKQILLKPERFRGFACLGMQDVASACDELRRCVNELGFVGHSSMEARMVSISMTLCSNHSGICSNPFMFLSTCIQAYFPIHCHAWPMFPN